MEYTPHNWRTGETVTSNKLNNMEEGLSDAAREINELKALNPFTGEVDVTDSERNQALANVSNQTANSITGKMGYIVLQPEKAGDATTSFAAQIADKPNTIFEIRDVFDLDGSVTIPANCTLKFNGGILKNGILNGNNTYISNLQDTQIFDGLVFSGTYNTLRVYPEWFGAKKGFVTVANQAETMEFDSTDAILSAVQYCANINNGILVLRGLYKITQTIYIKGNVAIIGESSSNFYARNNSQMTAGLFCDFVNPYSWAIDADVYFTGTTNRVPYRYKFEQSPSALFGVNTIPCKIEGIKIHSAQNNPIYGGIRLFQFNGCIVRNVTIEYSKVGMWLTEGWGGTFEHIDLQVLEYGLISNYIVTDQYFTNIVTNIRAISSNISDTPTIDISPEDTLYGYLSYDNCFPNFYTEEGEDVTTKKIAFLCYGSSNCELLGFGVQNFDIAFSIANATITIAQSYLEDIKDCVVYCNQSTVSVGQFGGTITNQGLNKYYYSPNNSKINYLGFKAGNAGSFSINATMSSTYNTAMSINDIDIDTNYLYHDFDSAINVNLGDTLLIGSNQESSDYWGKKHPIPFDVAMSRIKNNRYYAGIRKLVVIDNSTCTSQITFANNDIEIYGERFCKITLADTCLITGNCRIKSYRVSFDSGNKSAFNISFNNASLDLTLYNCTLTSTYTSGLILTKLSSQFNLLKVSGAAITNRIVSNIGKNMSIVVDGVDLIAGSGLFADRPTITFGNDHVAVGMQYFCTDKQTTEGLSDGIMLTHKGSGVWVDALGRIVS